MNFKDNIYCLYYNLISSFYICLNMIFPYYYEEVIYFNSKNTELIVCNNLFDTKKRKENFLIFMDKLLEKNNDIIKIVKIQKEFDYNLDNYIIENNLSDTETSEEENSDNNYSDNKLD